MEIYQTTIFGEEILIASDKKQPSSSKTTPAPAPAKSRRQVWVYNGPISQKAFGKEIFVENFSAETTASTKEEAIKNVLGQYIAARRKAKLPIGKYTLWEKKLGPKK